MYVGWVVYHKRTVCRTEEGINTTNTKSSQIVKSVPPLATNKPAYMICAKAEKACVKMRTIAAIHGYYLMFISGHIVNRGGAT